MSQTTASLPPIIRKADGFSGPSFYLGVVSILMIGLAFVASSHAIGVVLAAVGATFGFIAVLTSALKLGQRKKHGRLTKQIAALTELDKASCFVTDRDGEIVYQNTTAADRFSDCKAFSLAHVFRDLFANPSAVLFRLQNKAQAVGAAQEDVVTRRGHTRLSVHRIAEDAFYWRIDDFGQRSAKSRGAEGVSLPMLTASKSGTVLFMNEAMRKVLGGRVKTLDRVFNHLPITAGAENEVIGKDGLIKSLVAEIEGASGRSEIYLIPGLEASANQDGRRLPTMDELPVPLLTIAKGGQIIDANRLARDMLADPIEPGATMSDLVEGLGRSVNDWLEDAFDGRGLQRSEVIRAKKPEPEAFLQISLARFMDGDEPTLIAILTDATELKTLEAQFVQSQKMQAIGQLAGGIAHDFNNLLTAITGHCDLLLLRHDQGDPDFGDLVQINENANRAASLVGQLLAFSRKQNLQPEVIDLRDTLSDLTHLLNRLVGERVSLTLSHDPDLAPVRADRRQLEQVIMNLVVNARDAMVNGGEIRIETELRTLTQTLKRDRAKVPPGKYATIKVIDQGHGVPQDKLAKIFEPFYTTKRVGEGTGLGLSMAYGIVKQSGGFIFVDSVVGGGTEFTLFFPTHTQVAAVPAERSPCLTETALPPRGEGVVLLVEDEAPVRSFASRALRMRGYTVLEAESAEDALKTLEDSTLNVDLFVTDVMMPGMDGPSWVKRALKERPEVKVVFVSGYAEDAFGDSPEVIPNSVFLPKPFSLNELTNTVQRQLH
ncbi:ATP-binding protein [Aliiroseovarius sp. YM-037]|uniref:hybrid sensor histidine kinase/response regulator n=1 Tax=Aliiroseovarius sp. YM-037 TaxID=3341728 RepID=UPI003A80C461